MSEEKIKNERTCIGCGRKFSKRDLHRIVRTKEGDVFFDRSGNVGGRGAYVCSKECFMKAQEKRKFARALKIEMTTERARALADSLEEIPACAPVR